MSEVPSRPAPQGVSYFALDLVFSYVAAGPVDARRVESVGCDGFARRELRHGGSQRRSLTLADQHGRSVEQHTSRLVAELHVG